MRVCKGTSRAVWGWGRGAQGGWEGDQGCRCFRPGSKVSRTGLLGAWAWVSSIPPCATNTSIGDAGRGGQLQPAVAEGQAAGACCSRKNSPEATARAGTAGLSLKINRHSGIETELPPSRWKPPPCFSSSPFPARQPRLVFVAHKLTHSQHLFPFLPGISPTICAAAALPAPRTQPRRLQPSPSQLLAQRPQTPRRGWSAPPQRPAASPGL